MKIDEIYLGDAYELIKKIPSGSVDLVIADPPYLYQSTGGGQLSKRPTYTNIKKMTKGFDFGLLDELVRTQKKINMYIWCAHDQFKDILDYMVDTYKCKRGLIIWKKLNPIPFNNRQYLKDCEYCLYFHASGAVANMIYDTASTCYLSNINQYDLQKYKHPTIKPLELIKNFVFNSSNANQTVLDPFMGSGTTAVASKILNRHYIGFEINEEFYKIARDRVAGIDQHGQTTLDLTYEQTSLDLGEEKE